MNGNRLENALDKWWLKAEQKQFLYGTVGRVNADATVTIVVPQRPDFVYVLMTDSTLAQARNQRRVPLRAGLPVRMRRENGTLVILEEDRSGLLENDPNAPGTVYSVNGQTGDVLLDFIDLTDVPAAYTGHANKVVAVKAAEDGLEFVVNASDVAAAIVAAADKPTPVDADLFALVDSAASFVLKQLTWANLKATLKVYLDTLYLIVAGKAGGQTASGGTAASENLVLDSTAHATKGVIALQPSGGHVGIGTSAPGVDVVGTTDITAAPILQLSGATPRFVLHGSTNTSMNLIDTGAGANVKWIRFLSDDGFSKFQSLTDAGGVQADNILVLDHSNGNVGIGTATPGVDVVGTTDITNVPLVQIDGANPRLVLRGSGDAAMNLIDTGAGSNVKWMRLITDGGLTEFQSVADAGTLQVDNILVLDHSNGNIGIGTATPGTDVVGTTDIAATPILQLSGATPRLVLHSSASAGVHLLDTGTTIDLKWMRLITDGGFTKFASLNDAGTTRVDNIVVMDHNLGQVGINTATLATGAALTMGGDLATAVLRAVDVAGLGIEDDGGTVALFVTDGGQVSIATATPVAGAELTVNGQVNISGVTTVLQLESSSWASLGFGHHFYSDGGSPELMVLGENGRLGIGVGVPSHELDVAGSMRSTGNVNVGDGTEATAITLVLDGAAGSSRSVAFRTGGVNRWLYQVTATAESGSNVGSDFSLLRRADNGAAIDSAFFIKRSTGNVGLGNVTSPSAKLHVDQASTTDAIPTLRLRQADLSEEFIRFDTTVAAGNPINTTALGSYYGRARVYVEGVGAKWLALYN